MFSLRLVSTGEGILLCWLCLALPALAWPAEEGDLAPATLQRLKAVLHEAIAQGEYAGAAHLVVRDGKPIFYDLAGVRDVDDQTPFDPDTIVRIYSMTKPITSVAALCLYEQGKFQLDDPLSKFLPTFADTKVFGEGVK